MKVLKLSSAQKLLHVIRSHPLPGIFFQLLQAALRITCICSQNIFISYYCIWYIFGSKILNFSFHFIR